MKMKNVKIAKSVPTQLIRAANEIAFDRIPKSKHPALINQIKNMGDKHLSPLKRKLTDADYLIESIPDACPQKLIIIINSYDWGRVPAWKKTAGAIAIRTYLKSNNYLRV